MNSKTIIALFAVLFLSASAQYYSPYAGYYGGYYNGLSGYAGYTGYASAYPGYGYAAYAYPGYGVYGYGSNNGNGAANIKGDTQQQTGSNVKLTNNN
uniref:Uncharacterized protein n=1 Tax=Parastrongyloides trichosuri TaxID=131310 RepID=A0A0N4ZZW9_PARTI